MTGLVKTLVIVLLSTAPLVAVDSAVVKSAYANEDVALQLDPGGAFWRASPAAYMEKDGFGKLVPHYRTEIRTRWTKENLYFLFICPYEELHLKPDPNTTEETNQLWNWDVAEVFVGADFGDIQRYKEFEVSPQGEWIDLDVNLHNPHHEEGWTWNSGFQALARIDPKKHVWYAGMRIPWSAIDTRTPAPGNKLRLNLFRSQGPPGHAHEITWQPPLSKTFHVPERFGLLELVKQEQ